MADASSTQKAAYLVRGSSIPTWEIREGLIPELQPWEVLVKLTVSGVCGSDLGLALGHLSPACDIVGHEGVGRIVRLGSGVNPQVAKLGDRIGIAWIRDVCGECACCLEPGGETRCLTGMNSGVRADGTFAEHCVVPIRYLLKLPEELGLSDEVIAPILCGGVTSYKALKIAKAVPGDWVAIIGAAGGVGGLGVQYGKAMGYRVVAVDVGQDRAEYCKKLGAEAYLDALQTDLADAMVKTTGGSKAKAVVVTANTGKAYQSAFNLVAPFGDVVCVGIPPQDHTLTVHPLLFIGLGINLIGSAVGTKADTLEALDFVRRGLVTPPLFPIALENLNEVTKDFSSVQGKYVIKY